MSNSAVPPADLPPIRLAMVGAGIFARTAHLPAILAQPERFQVTAVCSRSLTSAQGLAALLPQPVSIFTDLADLLADDTVDAVDLVLPIHLLPEAVAASLAAGKHVISEKPIAPTVAQAQALIHQQAAQHPETVWMVAENWRYEPSFAAAAQAVKSGEIGRPVCFDWSMQLPVKEGNPYYDTEWRRTNRFPGGFLMDAGVHHTAALRLILGEVGEVSAFAASARPDLPPADTLAAALHFGGGVVGSYSVTYASASELADNGLHIVGSEGSLRVGAGWLTITGKQGQRQERFDGPSNIQREFAAFADAIRQGLPHRNPPVEALRDLAVMEALLTAARTGERVAVQG
jgi:predicted dehydrogenase